MESTYNKFDLFIVILIGLIAFGGYGGAIQPIRIASVLCIPVVIANWRMLIRDKHTYNLVFFLLVWYGYLVISMLWTLDPVTGRKDLVYFPIHMNLLFSILLFAKKANNPLKAIVCGWLVFLIVALPTSVIEIFTDQHFSLSRLQGDIESNFGEGIIELKKFAAFTFFNYNDFCVTLCFAFPFALSSFLFFKKKIYKLIAALLILTSLYIVITNASRGATIATGLMLMIFLLFTFKSIKSSRRYIFILVIFIFILLYYAFVNHVFDQFLYRLMSRDSILEDDSRSNLMRIGLEICADSYFLGAGAGSVAVAYAAKHSLFEAAHNLLFEIMIQFGILIALAFVILLIRMFLRGIKMDDLRQRLVTWCALIPFPFVIVVSSGYLDLATIWVFLASVFVFTTYQFKQ